MVDHYHSFSIVSVSAMGSHTHDYESTFSENKSCGNPGGKTHRHKIDNNGLCNTGTLFLVCTHILGVISKENLHARKHV